MFVGFRVCESDTALVSLHVYVSRAARDANRWNRTTHDVMRMTTNIERNRGK